MKWLLVAFLGLGSVGVAAPSDNPATRAIILANADDPDSLRIAQHYAEVRGVPLENLIALKMPLVEAITWRDFIGSIWEPLRTELIARKWIDGIPIEVTDNLGRKKYAMNHHRISALVVCRGVPLKIAHAPEFYEENKPLTQHKEFRTNAGAVDAELALLATNNYNINAFIANPLFNNESTGRTDRTQIISVGRLDGPTPDDAYVLVDHAITAERIGLIGRAYVDLGGPFPEGDRWLESAARQIEALGFDLTVDRAPSTFETSARFDAAALYFGWYAGGLNGPPTLPGFQFPAGAIAVHIHSYSADSLRSANAGWTAPLIARGASASVGNVFEPYLGYLHRPDLLLKALARGEPLGEAALYALPGLSWQTVLVGDPLYRPFAVSLDEQWENRGNLPAAAMGYITLRRMGLLERAGKNAEALALGRSVQLATPSLALAVGLGQRLQKGNDFEAASAVLEYATNLKTFPPDEWVLAQDAAKMLAAGSGGSGAVAIYRTLFGVKTIPTELRVAWLRQAAKLAQTAKDPAQAAAWEKEAEELNVAAKK